MVTPLSWLERVPTYKEAFENVTDKDLHTYGFLGYPCLQTADIAVYSRLDTPLFVPVGEDQVSHVELSREIVRRLNIFTTTKVAKGLFESQNKNALRAATGVFSQIGTPSEYVLADAKYPLAEKTVTYWTSRIQKKALEEGIDNFLDSQVESVREFIKRGPDTLTEPQEMLTKTPRIPGLDGRKMSKSYGNAITLCESDDDIRKKDQSNGHGPGPQTPDRPRQSRRLPRLRLAQTLLLQRNSRLGRSRLPHRRHRLH